MRMRVPVEEGEGAYNTQAAEPESGCPRKKGRGKGGARVMTVPVRNAGGTRRSLHTYRSMAPQAEGAANRRSAEG